MFAISLIMVYFGQKKEIEHILGNTEQQI